MFVCADGADGFLVSAGGRDGPVLCYVARNAPGCTLSATQTVDGRKLATLSLAGRAGRSRSAASVVAECGGCASQSRADGAVLRIARRDGKGAGDHVRLSAHPQAVRKADRQLPGAAAPGGRTSISGPRRCGRWCSRSRPTTTPIASIPRWPSPRRPRRRKTRCSSPQACIQLHGAIGFTDEHDIGLYLKRAMLLSSLLGNAAAQRRRYVAVAELTA